MKRTHNSEYRISVLFMAIVVMCVHGQVLIGKTAVMWNDSILCQIADLNDPGVKKKVLSKAEALKAGRPDFELNVHFLENKSASLIFRISNLLVNDKIETCSFSFGNSSAKMTVFLKYDNIETTEESIQISNYEITLRKNWEHSTRLKYIVTSIFFIEGDTAAISREKSMPYPRHPKTGEMLYGLRVNNVEIKSKLDEENISKRVIREVSSWRKPTSMENDKTEVPVMSFESGVDADVAITIASWVQYAGYPGVVFGISK